MIERQVADAGQAVDQLVQLALLNEIAGTHIEETKE